MTTHKEHTQHPSRKEKKTNTIFVSYLYPVCVPSPVTLFFSSMIHSDLVIRQQ